jgi:hypothetical protein
MSLETSLLTILVFLTVGMMVAVTGGIAYLTSVEWRDRRRREREQKEQRRVGKPAKRRS